MSTVRTSNLGPLTGNTASVVDPSTPAGGSATFGPMVSYAAVASTSGTSVNFSGIPSWAKKVTVSFAGVSTSGNQYNYMQLGTAGGLQASGYNYMMGLIYGTSAGSYSPVSTAFAIANKNSSSDTWSGAAVFTLITSNTWAISSILGNYNVGRTAYVGGHVALSGTLTQLRVFDSTGGTFTAGTIGCMYE